ncbi:MAG: hypothetical protein FJ398_08825 [Verrucomicrobia bacterium]|nr:hypothetical protein [Verrucomicrobiota bacterium]
MAASIPKVGWCLEIATHPPRTHEPAMFNLRFHNAERLVDGDSQQGIHPADKVRDVVFTV